ncbi:MAG TPA: SusD/RagB family nutrient-binding outer membrane lipoprotein [Flavobacterium sp.]|uniref:SusD/RagB family nutrient-binding outer membrane lipoprotein n=1 Tax=Flavobacterium sp. TaxID=239 RepID=UPI002BEEBF5D|nr:SusD/RagB family nutrient-binding outer membrane lipoprotein [Flavobacterium sp.]HSD14843.1 SusD/RagB family nutrient-binding outer membrane lipoprotein [Flavobacterium sp.]
MKRIKFILPLIAGFMLFSCSDYLDVNNSSDNPDANLVTPNLSLAAAQSDSYRTLTQRMNEYGNVFMNNWGANVNSFTGGYAEEFGITLSNNFYDDIWDGVYRGTGEFSRIINHPAANYENHKAIAMICKAFYMQYMVDLYGDVPYSQAHLGLANLSPAYDDDKEIYRDLVVQLENAVNMIDHPTSTTKAVGAEDVILGGNMLAWKKFANTLKLRILLRQSELTDADTQTYLAGEFAELAGAAFVDQDVTINPGYSNGSDSRQNPFYTLMYDLKEVNDPTRAERTAFRFRRASAYIANQLNVSPVDPRRGRLFSLIGGEVVGVEQGADNDTAPDNISSLGTGLVISSEQDGYMMLLAESLLLQAEAVHKGYLAVGDPQTLFDNAIVASMFQLGAPVGDIQNYIDSVNLIVGKGYGALGATPEQQLEAIFYQKSIALNGINGAEIFIEYTRARKNGMPLIDANIDMPIPGVTPDGNHKPRRLMYPVSEISNNTANVPAQTVTDCYTSGPFWFAQ